MLFMVRKSAGFQDAGAPCCAPPSARLHSQPVMNNGRTGSERASEKARNRMEWKKRMTGSSVGSRRGGGVLTHSLGITHLSPPLKMHNGKRAASEKVFLLVTQQNLSQKMN